jgi:hypothetical protein
MDLMIIGSFKFRALRCFAPAGREMLTHFLPFFFWVESISCFFTVFKVNRYSLLIDLVGCPR